MGIKTMRKYLELGYDKTTELVGSVVVAIYDLMVTVTQVIATRIVLSTMLGWDPAFSMVVGD